MKFYFVRQDERKAIFYPKWSSSYKELKGKSIFCCNLFCHSVRILYLLLAWQGGSPSSSCLLRLYGIGKPSYPTKGYTTLYKSRIKH